MAEALQARPEEEGQVTAAEILEWTRTHRHACYLAVTEIIGPRHEGESRGHEGVRLEGIHRAAANVDSARALRCLYPDWPPARLGLEFRQLVLAGKLARWFGRPQGELRWLDGLRSGPARAWRAALIEDARQRLQEEQRAREAQEAEYGSSADE